LHEEFFTKVNEDRLIAAIKHPKGIEQFLQTNLHVSFLQTGNISVIKRYVQLLKNANRFVFLHIEKIPGISYDREGLQFLAKFVQPTGIVTTKSSLIQLAKKEGLISIQRLFLIDTDAVKNGLQSIQEVKPDALELMPGIIPEMIKKVKQKTNVPIITGGLIRHETHILHALESGAIATSVGSPILWKKWDKEREEKDEKDRASVRL
jgi:glycerol uptake operon antiterminator